MYFKKLTLIGYKRLLLNNTDYFSIEPNEKIQLILGTNGSGKSSILKELTPLPAQSSDYRKGGKKEVVIVNGADNYTLTSDFTGTAKHSFIKNGEELNQSGTISIQKVLVEQEFGITFDLHEIMISLTGFCDMSGMERRKWFTKFSNNDYTFAFNTYNKVRTDIRDIVGAIKLQDSRLATESKNLLTKDEKIEIEKEVFILRSNIDKISSLKKNVDRPISAMKGELSDIDNILENKVNHLNKLLASMCDGIEYFDVCTLSEKISEMLGRKTYLESMLSASVETFNKLKLNIDNNYVADNQNIDSEIEKLTQTVAQLKKTLGDRIVNNNAEMMLSALESVEAGIVDILMNMDSEISSMATVDVFEKLDPDIYSLKEELGRDLNNQIRYNNFIIKQEEILKGDDISCPKCDYVWKEGFQKDKFERAKVLFSEGEKKISVLEDKIKALNDTKEKIHKWLYDFKSLNSIFNRFGILIDLWVRFGEDLRGNPRKCINKISFFKSDLKYNIELQNREKELEELLETKRRVDASDKEEVDGMKNRLALEDNKISDLTHEVRVLNGEINRFKQKLNTRRNLDALNLELINFNETRESIINEMFISNINFILDKLNNNYVEPLLQLEKKLANYENQESIVNNIQSYRNELKFKLDNLVRIEKALSPKDGIIATALINFINFILSQMNTFIKKVWVYPLEISLVEIDEGLDAELDYKFLLAVGENRNIVPDISKASSAMKEIIDLSFKIVTMKFFGLSDYPVYLDEFGSSFDTGHRLAAMHVISELMQNSSFSQLFIVSHYEESYGSLTNSEICVLSQTNITMPKNSIFNRHVKIE